jgi:perosamine synthetase
MAQVTDTRDAPFYEPHRVPLARPYFDEREAEAAAAVVATGMLCQGARVAELERAFAAATGVDFAVAVSSGSTALLVALDALGVGTGDEVIVPAMTFVSTATAAMYLGARPVFCDIELETYSMNPAAIEPLITERTRAIVPVHYGGQVADMDPINEIAAARQIAVLEDAAGAHTSRYRGDRPAGSLGDAAIFSFTPSKVMTCGEGGMITTGDAEIAERCRRCRNFGDHSKFEWRSLGFNFRMTEVAAAIGLVQLDKLEHMVAARRRHAADYDAGIAEIAGVIGPASRGPNDANHQIYTVRFDLDALDCDRDRIAAELGERGVASRVYFPALPEMGVFAAVCDRRLADFPNAALFDRSALSLPIFTSITEAEKRQVIDALAEVVAAHRR